jgi:hypothetical protein
MLKYNLDLSSKERTLLETIFCKNGIEGNRILQRIRESQQLSVSQANPTEEHTVSNRRNVFTIKSL